ncbi:unnamed protein product [Phyllotreta striolata]|uniref:Kinesin motor domain-containing protein n=1 Tax=Phyllotreta striolata TaxID=444603 RepID=A0A9N9TTC3_PHYSR|nr:unnamed protein product [Phyllotreta striolata]
MASVKVAVRVRPFNQREIDMDAQLIIQMKGKTTGILNCKANTRDESIRYKEFTFDYSYWSFDRNSNNYASQDLVYDDLGKEVIDCAFEGYNACVFAYGQTGSGKTFTMMGSPENEGLIPRICKALFDKMAENSKLGTTHRVQVSYLEIYQERVVDLLKGRTKYSLKVREHPTKGPYVQGLTTCLVTNYNRIQECMERGNAHRTTASTNMNDVSSRSHAIFTITFVQAGYCNGVPSETVSKIHLVDLAGSERADATGASGQRLKEGAHINKSLVTLGSVISALAELSLDENGQKRSIFIPYRDSVLTWLLKDSLGGNSKTIMIAAISPADCNYGETLSTLRYANRAKNIINKPTVNEDPNVKLIRELREEITKLRALMFCEQRSDMLEQLYEKEALEKELTEEWTGKWREVQAILREQKALGLRKSGPGVILDSDRPHLIAIEDDPLTTGVTLYHLKEGKTTIGTAESKVKQDIELKGAGMKPHHCTITCENGVATLIPHPGAQVMLNNISIESEARLSQGCIIFLGKVHAFRFNDPVEAAELRKGEKSCNLSRVSRLSWSTPDLAVSMENLQISSNDEDKVQVKEAIENQRLDLKKEKEQFEKKQEAFEKQQVMFEEKKRSLLEAQAKLEAERKKVQEEFAQQTRQLQEDWRNLSAHQRLKEIELERKEGELMLRKEKLERERKTVMSEIENECSNLEDLKRNIFVKLANACSLVTSNVNEILFPSAKAKSVFQELCSKSSKGTLTEDENDTLVDILNNLSGSSIIKDIVDKHRKELAELQAELNRRVQILCERQKSIELLDKKIIGLVDEQKSINDTNDDLENVKQELCNRTEEDLKRIEIKKQELTLNLKRVNSAESPDSCEVNYSSSGERLQETLSSDTTYHTAPNTCSPRLADTKLDRLMSDSGVELRTSSRPQDESDLSSNEEKVLVSDSQSSSSIENRSPSSRKIRRRDAEIHLRRLSQRIAQQKQIVCRILDGHRLNADFDSQVAVLKELQHQYISLKYGSTTSLVPASDHPLQDADSPSPVRPLFAGSTSVIYPSILQNQIQRLPALNQYMCRSMPSINIETDLDAIASITSYCVRGTGTKTHYEYEIRINTADDRWCILRRYSRFRDLHIAMKARYGEKVSSIPFPSRIIFSNNETVAQTRKRQLEFYLRRLIDTCKSHPACPLAYGGPVTKVALINFSPFFRKGVFENGKYTTS